MSVADASEGWALRTVANISESPTRPMKLRRNNAITFSTDAGSATRLKFARNTAVTTLNDASVAAIAA